MSINTICRLLELKHEMMGLELLEFHYFDDMLADMKLTPVCSNSFFVKYGMI